MSTSSKCTIDFSTFLFHFLLNKITKIRVFHFVFVCYILWFRCCCGKSISHHSNDDCANIHHFVRHFKLVSLSCLYTTTTNAITLSISLSVRRINKKIIMDMNILEIILRSMWLLFFIQVKVSYIIIKITEIFDSLGINKPKNTNM